VAAPLTLAYVVLVFAAVTHTVVTSRRAELRESGMIWILGGLVVVLARPAVAFAFPLEPPAWSDALWILALPLSMTLAVSRQWRSRAGRPGAPAAAAT
jgi:hypothetical protein